ncbi:MAG: hypothetical protein IID49_03610 [Proteobacteria bacterium]|nr:hypothetical protein [Pseudomonadota bacterium]MCH8951203.1 hypothetical protein [Pseudomonadota bacterium]
MREEVLALLLMLAGLGCIVAWGACQAVAAIRATRLRREADAVKLHVVKGGRLPDRAPSTLARSYLQVRWLGIAGNILLFSGIVGMALAQVVIF